MFCIKCGTQLPDDANFCLKCGTSVKVGAVNAPEISRNWEYQTLTYEAMEKRIKLEEISYPYYDDDKQDKATATLKLWITNQRQIKQWLSEYTSQGWELAESLDSSCLRVKHRCDPSEHRRKV